MGIVDDIGRKIKSDLSYRASNEASSAILKGAEIGAGKIFKKGEKANECPKCKNPITPELKFCQKCGTKLLTTCSKCSVDYPAGTKFCGQCGETLK